MKRYINLKTRFDVILTFVLILFSLIGYVPKCPYMLSNSILIILPLFVLLYIRRIRFTNNIITFVLTWLFISIVPYIVNSSEMFSVNTSQKVIVDSLKIFGVLFVFFLGYTNSLNYEELCKVLYFILILNFILMSMQFFLMKPMFLLKHGEEAKWTYVINPPVFWKGRVVGLCGNANTVGSFVLFTVVFLYDWLKKNKRLLWITILLSVIAIGLYAKSRNNLLVGLLFIGYYVLFIRKNLKPLVTFLLFGLIFLTVIYFSTGSEITESIFNFKSFGNKINSLSVRLLVDSEAIKIWWKHLFWFGGGFASETFYMGKYHSTRLFTEMLYSKYLLEMGIIGAGFSVIYLYILYTNNLKNAFKQELFKKLLFITFCVSFFETVFLTQQLFYFLIFIFAWIAAQPNVKATTPFDCISSDVAFADQN